jgi:hypothetical protein
LVFELNTRNAKKKNIIEGMKKLKTKPSMHTRDKKLSSQEEEKFKEYKFVFKSIDRTVFEEEASSLLLTV